MSHPDIICKKLYFLTFSRFFLLGNGINAQNKDVWSIFECIQTLIWQKLSSNIMSQHDLSEIMLWHHHLKILCVTCTPEMDSNQSGAVGGSILGPKSPRNALNVHFALILAWQGDCTCFNSIIFVPNIVSPFEIYVLSKESWKEKGFNDFYQELWYYHVVTFELDQKEKKAPC